MFSICEGTGLGLFLVRQLLEKENETIELDNNSLNTTFDITLSSC